MVISSNHSIFADELCNEGEDFDKLVTNYDPLKSWNREPKFVWEEGGVMYIGFDEKYFHEQLLNIDIFIRETTKPKYNNLFLMLKNYTSFLFPSHVTQTFTLVGTRRQVLGMDKLVFKFEDYNVEMEKFCYPHDIELVSNDNIM